MNTAIKDEIVRLSLEKPTEEVCGFIYYNRYGFYLFPCANKAELKDRHFLIDSEDFVACKNKGEIYGIYHSHLEFNDFSASDIETSEEIGLPIYLFNVKTGHFAEYMPLTFSVKLTGQKFHWGFFDCYGLVRNYYRQELKIKLPDFVVDDSFFTKKNTIMLDNFRSMGFEEKHDRMNLHKNDVILFKPKFTGGGHLAVYVGNNYIMHHTMNGVSLSEPINGSWFNRIQLTLKHKAA